MKYSRKLGLSSTAFAMGAAMALISSAAHAQTDGDGERDDNLTGLKACQGIGDDTARLACFDKAVGEIVTATETGDLTVIGREEARQTRRSLFGFKLPNIGILGGNDDEKDELFETTIQSARFIGSRELRLVTAEGAVWELKNIPRRLQPVKPGDTAIFKPGSLGTYFIRINGQLGVRGRRVQ